MTNRKIFPRLSIRSSIFILVVGLIVLLGSAILISLNVVSKMVLDNQPAVFLLEPVDPSLPDLPISFDEPNITSFVEDSELETFQSEAVKDTINQLSWVFAAILFVTLIIAVVFTLWVSGFLSRPLVELSQKITDSESIESFQEAGSSSLSFEASALQNAFRGRMEKFEDLIKRQNDYVMNASHELRTPVAAIRINLDTVNIDVPDDQQDLMETLNNIEISTKRLESLLDQIDCIMENQENLSPIPIPLNALIDNCVDLLKPIAESYNVTIHTQTEPNLTLLSEPFIIQSVLTNLIENAIKYNHPGGMVDIRASSIENGCQIFIEDNGIGISKEHLPYIFDRFYRVDQSRSRNTGGSGLGLAFVQTLVNRVGGSIKVSSEEGVGTIFTLNFFDMPDIL